MRNKAAVMTDFETFRKEARAAFSDLNISVSMSDEGSALSSGMVYYHIKATGMPIGAQPLSARATSSAEAIRAMIGKVGPARRAVKAAAAAAQQARRNRYNPLPAPAISRTA
jgi:hypothetical protein